MYGSGNSWNTVVAGYAPFTAALSLSLIHIWESGKIAGSAPVSLVGPKGVVYLSEGCIVAMRHIHMSPDDAKKFGVENGQIVKVRFGKMCIRDR